MTRAGLRSEVHSPLTRSVTMSLVCLLLAIHALGGCAEMSEGQKGAAVGAGTGAVLGGLLGAVASPGNPARGAAIGAAAGLLVGGVAGWAIGDYRSRQVKPREQAVADTKYTPAQGVLINIDRTSVIPQQLKPGDQLTFQVQYTVLSPAQGNEMRIRETRTLLFGDQVVAQLSQREVALAQGTSEFTFPLKIPKDAGQGNYVLLTTMEPIAPTGPAKQEARSPFIVSP